MTTGPTDEECANTAGGPGGMPAALRLTEGLGVRVLKQRMDAPLKDDFVALYSRAPFVGDSIFVANCRRLAILFPCLLVTFTATGSNKTTEDFNCGAVRQERLLDMSVDVGPVVSAVVPSNVDEGECWGERGPKGCASRATFDDSSLFQGEFVLVPGEMKGKPVGQECPDQGAEQGGNKLAMHVGVSWQVLALLPISPIGRKSLAGS